MNERLVCPVCTETRVDRSAYAYLLGLYLGDGCLSTQGKSSWKLRIVQDARYVELVARCAEAMAAVMGTGRVRRVDRGSFIEIHSSWNHWICLFPQHGPGVKHKRLIALTDWQCEQLSGHQQELISGLIHSDGSRHINRVVRPTATGRKAYCYPRYQFTSYSDDIRTIFTDALDVLGVRWTVGGYMSISIARSRDVRFLDSFVPIKN